MSDSRVTRFPGRASGPRERIADFCAHCRANGLAVGVEEGALALAALTRVDAADPVEVRVALGAVMAKSPDERRRFAELFDAYWLNRNAARTRTAATARKPASRTRRPGLLAPADRDEDGTGAPDTPDDGGDEAAHGTGEGRLQGARTTNLARVDLREVVDPADFAAATAAAEAMARAIRHRRSRRTRADPRAARLDLGRIVRRSLATDGEPLHLYRRRRIDRPARLVAFCDVSGSMGPYARVFLAFIKGLIGADLAAEAFLFHTRLVRITDALRDGDSLRAVNRLNLLAEGFGGGTRIGANLAAFEAGYARRIVSGRTVLVVLSDGYDTEPPEVVADALARLRRRGCRILWLNPLKGWRGYEPVARAMAAALPHLDLFAAANTLDSLAALEPELARL